MTLAKKKEREKQERADKIKYKDMRIRAKSTDYKRELQREINKLSRQIDASFGYLCIDCGRGYGKQIDGAHFHTVGSHPSVRFNLHNIHSARSECNQYSEDHKPGYANGILSRYGQAYFNKMLNLPRTYPSIDLSPQEIYDKLAVVRKLNREYPKMNFKSAKEARDKLNKKIGIYLA